MRNILLICIVLIFSCSKDDCIWYSYAETGCLDKWMSYPHTTDDELAGAVTKYLKEQNIRVSKLNISFDSARMDYCFACYCETGRIIKIVSSRENEMVLKEIGFNVDPR